MAKKQTFQEYPQEALYEIEKTEAALKQAKLEKAQEEHLIQRSLNYLYTQKREETVRSRKERRYRSRWIYASSRRRRTSV